MNPRSKMEHYKTYKEAIGIRFSLEKDGYILQEVGKATSCRYYYYKHKNGNRISLAVDLCLGKIVLSKNGKVSKTFSE